MGYENYAAWPDPLGRARGDDAAPEASYEDILAARLLMGGKALTTMVIAGTTRNYVIERRPDTKNGGTYLFCPCKGWSFGVSRGRLCSHARQAEADGL